MLPPGGSGASLSESLAAGEMCPPAERGGGLIQISRGGSGGADRRNFFEASGLPSKNFFWDSSPIPISKNFFEIIGQKT